MWNALQRIERGKAESTQKFPKEKKTFLALFVEKM
jgi:hypothetical protein